MNFSTAKNWAEGSTFPVVSFRTQSIDLKTPLVQLSVNVIPPPNSERLFRSFAFNTPSPIEITIFGEITAPVSLIPIIATLIFISNSSPTNECLPFLLNFSGGSPTYFCGLEHLRFQLLTVVRFKVYCWYFPRKCTIAACVPYLCAYLPTSSLTFEGKSIWHFFFSLHEFFNSVLIAGTSAIVTLSDVLTNWEI